MMDLKEADRLRNNARVPTFSLLSTTSLLIAAYQELTLSFFYHRLCSGDSKYLHVAWQRKESSPKYLGKSRLSSQAQPGRDNQRSPIKRARAYRTQVPRDARVPKYEDAKACETAPQIDRLASSECSADVPNCPVRRTQDAACSMQPAIAAVPWPRLSSSRLPGTSSLQQPDGANQPQPSWVRSSATTASGKRYNVETFRFRRRWIIDEMDGSIEG